MSAAADSELQARLWPGRLQAGGRSLVQRMSGHGLRHNERQSRSERWAGGRRHQTLLGGHLHSAVPSALPFPRHQVGSKADPQDRIHGIHDKPQPVTADIPPLTRVP